MTNYIRVPVRTTSAIKEPRLRNRDGHLLVGHPFTNMTTSFIIEVEGEDELLQCGAWEFEARDEEPAT